MAAPRFRRAWTRLKPALPARLPPASAWVGLAALIALGLAGRWYLGYFETNRDWVAHVAKLTVSKSYEPVFKRLVEAGLIWLDDANGTLDLRYAGRDGLLDHAAQEQGHEFRGDPKDYRALMRLLWNSPQGDFIRAEIDANQRSGRVLAIRDDRHYNDPEDGAGQSLCADATRVIHNYLPPDCYPNAWSVFLVQSGGGLVPAGPRAKAAPSQKAFAFVAKEQRYFMSDWLLVDTSLAEDSAVYRLTTSVTFGRAPLEADVLGAPLRIRIGSAPEHAFTPDDFEEIEGGDKGPRAHKSIRIGAYAVEIAVVCHSRPDDAVADDCPPAPDEGLPHAYMLKVTGPSGDNADIQIEAQSALVTDHDAPARKAAMLSRPTAKDELWLSPHVRFACGAYYSAAGAGCGLVWKTGTASEIASGGGTINISTRDGVKLVDARGDLLDPGGLGLSLAGVIGMGPLDAGSLAAQLVHSDASTPHEIRLTIDAKAQLLAQQAVDARQDDCSAPPPPPRRKGQKPPKPKKFCLSEDRRTTFVVMDAGDDPRTRGEVLAAVAWPPVGEGVPIWDLEALEIGAPGESPVSGEPWRANDSTAVPGSTFKLVTALAGIQAALDGDQDVKHLLLGDTDIQWVAGKLGLAIGRGVGGGTWVRGRCDPKPGPVWQLDALPIVGVDGVTTQMCIGNSGDTIRGPLAQAYLRSQASHCVSGGDHHRIGLCEALITSSNLYFGGLALLNERDLLPTRGARESHPGDMRDLRITKMARRLFPDYFEATHGFDLLRGAVPLARRLVASPIDVRAARERREAHEPRRVELAQAGIGQSVSATAMAMTSAYASVASGKVTRPHLTPSDAAALADPEGKDILNAHGDEASRVQLMDQLRRGLHGVVTVGKESFVVDGQKIELHGGTATAAFKTIAPELRDRVFAKTGTAFLREARVAGAKRPLYTGWLVGWLEPKPGKAGARRIAFGCEAANVVVFGGVACGAAVAEFLRLWEQ